MRLDVSENVKKNSTIIEVETSYEGLASVVACTVIYRRNTNPYAVFLLDTTRGPRSLVTSDNESIIKSIEE